MSEEPLQSAAADYLRLRGWMVAHFRPAKTEKGWRTAGQYDARGFPDLCIAKGGQVRLIEVKSATGKVTAEQRAWLYASAGFILRPTYFDEFVDMYR